MLPISWGNAHLASDDDQGWCCNFRIHHLQSKLLSSRLQTLLCALQYHHELIPPATTTAALILRV